MDQIHARVGPRVQPCTYLLTYLLTTGPRVHGSSPLVLESARPNLVAISSPSHRNLIAISSQSRPNLATTAKLREVLLQGGAMGAPTAMSRVDNLVKEALQGMGGHAKQLVGAVTKPAHGC